MNPRNHSFHIPVMGIGFTIDTPVKVAHLGIDSVISLVDDMLMEKMRRFYCEKMLLPYQEISDKIDDFRAKRITSYLNLMKEIADHKLEDLKTASHDKIDEIKHYFQMLPDSSELKNEFNLRLQSFSFKEMKEWLKENLSLGNIDVNIMTKVDKDNYKNGEKLPVEFNDAHAALRGFAQSNLNSSVVLSAGMNPRLYAYMEQFEDFFPSTDGVLKKRIILKVSDYRSALIQGKFLAKKGLWVSEYRIESGLNCGGHAFATEGFLMGPVLEEFKLKRQELTEQVWAILSAALISNNKQLPEQRLSLRITAQGGVGTSEEHDFLRAHYQVDSVGWGTPFLLVPEVTSVDKDTREQLKNAKEKDLYLSGISPLGVPFNTLRGNTKDIEKQKLIDSGKPGSLCPKKYVELNYDYTEKAICTASYRYQRLKIKDLNTQNLPTEIYQKKYNQIVEKSCVCVGLGTSALLANNLDTTIEGPGVSICPGPNLAYFDKEMSLKELSGHIYGRNNVIDRTDRPHMFVKELNLYLDHLKTKMEDAKQDFFKKHEKQLTHFNENMQEGVRYYQSLFTNIKGFFAETKQQVLADLEKGKQTLLQMELEIKAQSEVK